MPGWIGRVHGLIAMVEPCDKAGSRPSGLDQRHARPAISTLDADAGKHVPQLAEPTAYIAFLKHQSMIR